MEMKKIKLNFLFAAIIAILIAVSTISKISLAHSPAEEASMDAGTGTLPTSPFYFMKLWGEKISLFFMHDKDARLDKIFDDADLRLSEISKLVLDNQKDKINSAVEDHKKLINMAAELVNSNSGKTLDDLDFNVQMEKRLEEDMDGVVKISTIYGFPNDLTEKLKYDFLIDALTTPVSDINVLVIGKYDELQKNLGNGTFQKNLDELRKKYNVQGLIEQDAQKAIDETSKLLNETDSNPAFTKEHYDEMAQELKSAIDANERGNFVTAKSIAVALGEHIRTEMIVLKPVNDTRNNH